MKIYSYLCIKEWIMLKNNSSTIYRQELKGKILDTAMGMFQEKGIRRVKMDDIAQKLSISKRTLYEIYENKEQLLYEGVQYHHQMLGEHIRQFAQGARNEIEIVMEAMRCNLNYLGHVNPLFFSELRKYERVLSFLQENREEQRDNSILFLKSGVEHGYFRKDINYDIVTNMGDAIMNYVMESKMYEKYPLSEIFTNYVNVMFRGICTEKGLAELKL